MNNNRVAVTIFLLIFALCFLTPILPILGHAASRILPNINGSAIVIIIIGIIVVWGISTYNSFVKLSKKAEQAKGGIDVYLKQRFDLIPNLVETVKGYAKYEQKVIENITELRQEYNSSDKTNIKQCEELNNKYTRMLAVVENYPELKASEQFLNLQKNLSKIESQLQAARRIYNMEVTEYNIKREKFPSNLIGSIFGFRQMDLFEITTGERENVNI